MRFAFTAAALSMAALAAPACSSDVDGLGDTEQALVVQSNSCRVEYTVSSEWGSGFGANVVVTNRGAPLSSWRLEWNYANGQQITSLWNGVHSQNGGAVTVRDAGWNANLGSNASVSFGFNGTLSGSNGNPQNFRLNGVSCEGGGTGSGGSGGGTSTGGTSGGGGTSTGGTSSGGSGGGGTCNYPQWQAGTNYTAGSIVVYNGSYYIAEHDNPGYDPTISTWFWDPYTGGCGTGGAGGGSGGTSTGGTSSGGSGGGGTCNYPQWQQGQNYSAGDIVGYQGSYYIAKHPNPGYSPTISTWYWDPYTGGCGGTGGSGGGGTGGGGTGGSGGSGGGTSGFEQIVSKAQFESMFPNRNSFYTYEGLVEATKRFPAFAGTGDLQTRRREAAAFLANAAHETIDFVYIEEIAKGHYCGDWGPPGCSCAPGKQYFGRGPMQLSWNGNYCAASIAIFGDMNVLRNDPDRVARESWLAWTTAIWFWMTQAGAGHLTAHSAIVDGHGFGQTIRTINGSVECDGRHPAAVQSRINHFINISGRLGVDPGGSLGC